MLPIEFQSKSDEKRREEKRMTAVTKWKGNAATPQIFRPIFLERNSFVRNSKTIPKTIDAP
jgi:hypothetical protein